MLGRHFGSHTEPISPRCAAPSQLPLYIAPSTLYATIRAAILRTSAHVCLSNNKSCRPVSVRSACSQMPCPAVSAYQDDRCGDTSKFGSATGFRRECEHVCRKHVRRLVVNPAGNRVYYRCSSAMETLLAAVPATFRAISRSSQAQKFSGLHPQLAPRRRHGFRWPCSVARTHLLKPCQPCLLNDRWTRASTAW